MNNEQQLYKNSLTTNINNFVMLYEMMNEYNRLSYDQKRKYMNSLSTWYMREKDNLNNVLNKDHDTN
jgi:hypothetical protein